MRVVVPYVVLALCLAGPAHGADSAADVTAIHAVVDQFQTAIIARDGQALANLFVQDHDSWLSVADDATWAKAKAANPQARKVSPGSWKKFSQMIQHARQPVEERFHDVRIETNGAVASVWFGFDFLVGGKVTNRGSETWQMVRAEDGWKISSMLFSEGD